jgi:hypothetical protein
MIDLPSVSDFLWPGVSIAISSYRIGLFQHTYITYIRWYFTWKYEIYIRWPRVKRIYIESFGKYERHLDPLSWLALRDVTLVLNIWSIETWYHDASGPDAWSMSTRRQFKFKESSTHMMVQQSQQLEYFLRKNMKRESAWPNQSETEKSTYVLRLVLRFFLAKPRHLQDLLS